MNKKTMMVTLSMALVVGVAGIVNAATTGSNTSGTSSQHEIRGVVQGATSLPDQTTSSQVPIQPSQSGPKSTNQDNINTPMNNRSMTIQGQNMPMNSQMQSMPMTTPNNGQMGNSQSMQGTAGAHQPYQTNASGAAQSTGQYSRGNMMGSMGRMGR